MENLMIKVISLVEKTKRLTNERERISILATVNSIVDLLRSSGRLYTSEEIEDMMDDSYVIVPESAPFSSNDEMGTPQILHLLRGIKHGKDILYMSLKNELLRRDFEPSKLNSIIEDATKKTK